MKQNNHPILACGIELKTLTDRIDFLMDMNKSYFLLDNFLDNSRCVDMELVDNYRNKYNLDRSSMYENMLRMDKNWKGEYNEKNDR